MYISQLEIIFPQNLLAIGLLSSHTRSCHWEPGSILIPNPLCIIFGRFCDVIFSGIWKLYKGVLWFGAFIIHCAEYSIDLLNPATCVLWLCKNLFLSFILIIGPHFLCSLSLILELSLGRFWISWIDSLLLYFFLLFFHLFIFLYYFQEISSALCYNTLSIY